MNQVRNYLKEIGFTDENINIILEAYSICNMSEEILLKHCIENNNFFLENNYTKEEVIKMTKLLPALYSLSIENIKQKIEDMILLGYIKEEVIKMTKSLPALYGYSIENIKQKIEDMMLLGYTKEEVIKMTKSLPALYGYSIENIKKKADYLREIKLDFIIVEDTKKLMQSTNLTYARNEFLKDNNINVSNNNYQLLFKSNLAFTKQFNITKKELLEKYQYENKEERRNKI